MAQSTTPIPGTTQPTQVNPLDRGPGGPNIAGQLPGNNPFNSWLIPPAIIANPTGQTPAPNPAAPPTRTQLTTASRNSRLPMLYGGYERLGGLLYMATIYQSKLTLCILLAQGPIQEIGAIQMNDQDLPATGVTVTKYLGTSTQNVDATLAAAFPGFNENLRGTAYIVVQIRHGVSQGFPRMTALCKGFLVFDPRTCFVPAGSASGKYLSTPDNSSMSLTGDITIDAILVLSNWTTGNPQSILTQRPGAPATNCGYCLRATGTGGLELYWSSNGTTFVVASSTVAVPVGVTTVRATRQSATGIVEFYTSLDAGDTWTLLGTQLTGFTTDPLNSTANFEIASYGGGTGELGAGFFIRVFVTQGFRGSGPYVGGMDAVAKLDGSPQTPGLTSIPGLGGETWSCFGAGTQTNSTTAWSDNPALILADYLINYGRKVVDWSSVATSADYCDAMIGTPAEKRSQLTILMDQKQTTRDWVNGLRAYIPGWVSFEEKVYLIPDAPRAVDHVFVASSIDMDPRPSVTKRGVQDNPNAIDIGYTRTDVTPWAIDYASAIAGSPVTKRKMRLDLPGIRRYSQAYRFAVEQLNHFNVENAEGSIGVFEAGVRVRLGDVAQITDAALGLSSFNVRVLGVSERSPGRWLIAWRSYDPTAYNNTVQTTPSSPISTLPDPKVVPAAGAITLTEKVYLEKTIIADSLARSLIYQSRWEASWVDSASAYPVTYRIELFDGTRIVDEVQVATPSYTSPAIQQGLTYTLRVYARNSLGFEQTIATLSTPTTAQGKLIPPGNVPSLTQAIVVGNEVLLNWLPAVDIDVMRYEWRYQVTGSYSWATAALLDRFDGLYARFRGLAPGTYRFGIKAIDSVGNYSVTDLTVDLTVGSDSSSFLQAKSFTSPTLTNMSLFLNEGDPLQKWISNFASDQWQTVEPNPFNSGGNPVASYHASGTSSFQSESWDLGATVTGTFALSDASVALTGAVTYLIEISANGSSWSTATTGTSWVGSTRFIRVTISTTTTGTLYIPQPPKMTLVAVTMKESSDPSAPPTSNAGSPKTITLNNHYTKLVNITVLVQGTAAREALYSNLTLGGGTNSFDVNIYDDTNTRVAANFTWSVEGY